MSTWTLGEKVVVDHDRQALYVYSAGTAMVLRLTAGNVCVLDVENMHVVTGDEVAHANRLLRPLGNELGREMLDEDLCMAEIAWNYDDVRDRIYVRPDALGDTYCILRVEGPYRPPYYILRAEDTMTFTGNDGDCFTHGDPDGYSTLREALHEIMGDDSELFEPRLEG